MAYSSTSDTELPEITGVILAGGKGSRMGGQDKGLIIWQEKVLYLHVLQRLSPQVTTILINANRNLAIYQQSGYPVISDTVSDFPGPLAGILSALEHTQTDWVVVTPCDTPLLPENLVTELWRHKGHAPAVWARSEERDHPTLTLLHRSLAPQLRQYLEHGERRLMVFLQQAGGHSVMFRHAETAFRNMNHPDDLQH